jgi:mannose-6-phosphate isomerase
MARWRRDLPEGPIGESWDLADHERGMSIVAAGPLAGRTLRELVASDREALVGRGFRGESFPLMVKLIDATDALSVQVHPDDELARRLGVGSNGKTECWLLLDGGGRLYQGTRPGVGRADFEAALAAGQLEALLNEYEATAGDFFFLDARTVHALGAGCLLYEIQQTSDITFRVYDWGRVGLDGQPRPLHVDESLATIDFSRSSFGPRRPPWRPHPVGGERRALGDCSHFCVDEHRTEGAPIREAATGCCAVVTCLEGGGRVATAGGALVVEPMQTVLVPAAAGAWRFDPAAGGARLLVARPCL